ncbi:hypothetical protein Y032_0669g1363 [Ancylostoma ceylanicum]|uniref:Uncharacterized protein n=1 Tax=Ancylostoma ceylanicum TaxID=53326 RepID=A0A016WHT1_9BILA|nr:hypothetical protein Y032_0669g1363 [Ancylostoma ceylanicum]
MLQHLRDSLERVRKASEGGEPVGLAVPCGPTGRTPPHKLCSTAEVREEEDDGAEVSKKPTSLAEKPDRKAAKPAGIQGSASASKTNKSTESVLRFTKHLNTMQ